MAIKTFIGGAELPKFYTHTCLVMIPKVESPQYFTDLRPISLCNLTSKIISKILNSRLSPILPKIISNNQSGFIKGRAISENILLAQEIINDIKKPNRGGNVVIKLDMTKAYDRVSWTYLCMVMRKMGFCEIWIDLIYRYISNNWYSIIVNGDRQGFFKSGKGLRQGDPLSPSLFVLSSELLSQMLNDLPRRRGYKSFYMNQNGPQVNHLSFADDTILFCNGSKQTLEMFLRTLHIYENTSGQLINKNKSCFSVANNAKQNFIAKIKLITCMNHQEFPIKYLGCPLISGKKKTSHFNELVKNIINRIKGWHNKLLSTGGRVVLIKHVLLAIPTHLLAALQPTKGTLDNIERYLARFFWSGKEEGGKHHWIAWRTLCLPFEEGGINIRRIGDVCNAFSYKQWWNLRTNN